MVLEECITCWKYVCITLCRFCTAECAGKCYVRRKDPQDTRAGFPSQEWWNFVVAHQILQNQTKTSKYLLQFDRNVIESKDIFEKVSLNLDLCKKKTHFRLSGSTTQDIRGTEARGWDVRLDWKSQLLGGGGSTLESPFGGQLPFFSTFLQRRKKNWEIPKCDLKKTLCLWSSSSSAPWPWLACPCVTACKRLLAGCHHLWRRRNSGALLPLLLYHCESATLRSIVEVAKVELWGLYK